MFKDFSEVMKENTASVLTDMFKEIESQASIQLNSFENEKTALIIVDMVNGFVKEGALSSPRVLAINERTAELVKACKENKIEMLAFCDSHNKDCQEFASYPPHCICETQEEKITSEIQKYFVGTEVKKNSTNGFIEPEFQKWLENHNNIENFIICGCCTDLCVLQFALSLKTDFNRRNLNKRVIVIQSLCETYDGGSHGGDISNLFAFYNMKTNGIEVPKDIVF